MTEQLDAFLKGGTPADEPDPLIDPQGWAKTQRAPEAPQAGDTPPPEAKALPESKPATEAPEPEEEALQHVQGGDNRTVPFSALEKVRNDWKSKYAAEQARAELLAKQLEEAKKPPQQQPQVPPQQQQHQMPPPPDPRTDLVGYLQYQEMRRQHDLLNERLNNSEERFREKLGDEKAEEYVAEFKQFADEALFQKLYSQRHPYGWLMKEVDRQRAMRDVGDDPAAYRARVIAEEKAKWEAELQAQQPTNGAARPSPVAGLPPSLANARSVAGRTQTAWTGPPDMNDILRRPDRRQQQR